jgi:hypothetical protein
MRDRTKGSTHTERAPYAVSSCTPQRSSGPVAFSERQVRREEREAPPVSSSKASIGEQKMIYISQTSAELATKIAQGARYKLSDVLDGKRGIEAYKYTISTIPKEGWQRFFKGNLYRYRLENEDFDYVQIEKTAELYHRGPRLGVRRIVSRSNRLMAAFLHSDFIVKKDIYCFIPSGSTTVEDLWFYLGLLNSSIASYAYLSTHASAVKDDFRQVSLQGLRDLPIPLVGSNERRRIIQLTQRMQNPTTTEKTFEEYDEEIDSLFFSAFNLSTPERIAINEFLKREG